jgi:mRNA-degrading endonuclease RelE of RelBE toxin-antitoxin system
MLWIASIEPAACRIKTRPLTIAQSGYILARMRFEILLAPEAVEDLKRLKANVRATIRDIIERHLRHAPAATSKSRIRRLRGLRRPQYRVRAGEIRIFYDIPGGTAEILAVVTKSEAEAWLEQFESGK